MSWSTSELRVRLTPLYRFKPSNKIFYWPFQGGTSFVDLLCFCSVLCLLCLCARLFICALWSPAGKELTSWLSFVVSNCEFVTFPLVSWVRCGTWLYRFLIFAPLLTFTVCLSTHLGFTSVQRAKFIIIIINSLLASLLITFVNRLNADQARQNFGPDLDSKCWHSDGWKKFSKESNLKRKKYQKTTKKACKIVQ